MLMTIFTIVFNDSTAKTIESESKETLIAEFSRNDATAFQENVKEIQWDEHDYHYIECISTGQILKIINSIKEK